MSTNANNMNSADLDYLFQLINESKDQTGKESECIDLTKEDDSFEDEKEINKSNFLLLGNKTQRQKEEKNNNNKSPTKKITFPNNNNANNNTNNTIINTANSNINTNNNHEKEREELLNLVSVEGFNTIFNLITKQHFDLNNPVEKKLDEIILNLGLLTTSLILFQIKFTFFHSTPISNPNFQNDIEKKKREMQMNDLENKGYILIDHLHKDKNGNIYKYLKHHLRMKKVYVYYCYDKKCKSRALYDGKNMNFKIIYEHTISYEEHNYISNKNKFDFLKGIFDDFSKRNCNEAQVFKNEEGDNLVKWYNNC